MRARLKLVRVVAVCAKQLLIAIQERACVDCMAQFAAEPTREPRRVLRDDRRIKADMLRSQQGDLQQQHRADSTRDVECRVESGLLCRSGQHSGERSRRDGHYWRDVMVFLYSAEARVPNFVRLEAADEKGRVTGVLGPRRSGSRAGAKRCAFGLCEAAHHAEVRAVLRREPAGAFRHYRLRGRQETLDEVAGQGRP